jgi:hypothetical protein
MSKPPMRLPAFRSFLFCSAFLAGTAHADAPCPTSQGVHGEVHAVVAAAVSFAKMLTPAERASLERPFTRDSAIRWSNLPIAIVPRAGLRLGDLDSVKSAAAHRLAEAALSACGLELLDEIRLADDHLAPLDSRKIGWSGGNYYLTFLGTPSERTAWMLQIGGHHLAYNLTFNGDGAGATPLFFGTEPIRFPANGVDHEPLAAQSTAMSRLAQALAKHPEALLSGTFTDVVKGVVVEMTPGKPPSGGTDTGFPQAYPTGTVDRGILYSALPPAEQALVRAALESYASLPGEAITRSLIAAYEAPDALAQTYTGYSGSPDLAARGSYVRIDGPRIWMELVVQPAVARPTELHYHALWRDKQSDYGGELSR